MDELTMFAELRPDDTLTEADLDTLRSELFPTVARPSDNLDKGQGRNEPSNRSPPLDRSPHVGCLLALRWLRRPWRWLVSEGIWVVADRQTEPAPTAPRLSPIETIATDRSVPGVYDMPLIGSPSPVGRHERLRRVEPRAARRGPPDHAGFDGPWADIKVSGSAGTVVTVPVGDTTVDVNGQTANVTEIDTA